MTPEFDSDLLEIAINNLAGYAPVDTEALTWSVTRIDRPLSVLFRLVGDGYREPIALYYKVHRQQVKDREELHSQLARAQRLTNRLIELSRESWIMVPPVLAVDPARLTIVTLGIPGHQLNKHPLLPPVTRSGRSAAIRRFRLIGRAILLIESASSLESISFDVDKYLSSMNRRIRRSAIGEPKLASQLRDWIEKLLFEAMANDQPVYAHGDLSPTNILVSDRSVGIIDFRWVSRFKTFDLGLISYRMRRVTPLYPQWRKRVNRALLDGYLDEAGGHAPEHAWRLTNAHVFVRAVSSRRPDVRKDALRLLRSLTDTGALDLDTLFRGSSNLPSWWWEQTSSVPETRQQPGAW